MRRMRFWRSFLIALVAVGIGFGAYRYHGKFVPGAKVKYWVATSVAAVKNYTARSQAVLGKLFAKTEKPAKDRFKAIEEGTPPVQVAEAPPAPLPTKVGFSGAVGSSSGSGGKTCAPAEFRGDSAKELKTAPAEWAKVMAEFHTVKRDLLAWLDNHSKEFSPQTLKFMQTQVAEIKIQRAPSPEDPDLSWRGIGVLVHDSKQGLLLRVGGGFTDLAATNPARAKFELARLVAQAWSPCEIRAADEVSSEPAWTNLAKCLDVAEWHVCSEGSFSESGWAISTTIAASVSPPGCVVPAFKDPKLKACLDQVKGAERLPAAERSSK